MYITIGTGVGAGIVSNGRVLEGILNPNVGHITVTRHPKDTFPGNCPIHKDCLEGLISNNAIRERKNLENVDKCSEVSDDDEIWDFISYYLGQLCLSLLYILSTEKIIIGGGVINRESLLKKTRDSFISINNNYVDHPNLRKEYIENFITRTNFKNYSGIISAFNLYNS